ncbi:MAG: energy transducer TonB, partial [Pseudomonadales bacterium]|nr:energy transducer TonB [Pseudomonadales bacterium]
GSVVVMYRISRDGRVVRPEVVSSEPEGVFDDAVLRAVSQREYIPAHDLVDAGQPVADHLVRRFDFRHPDGQADQTFEIQLR